MHSLRAALALLLPLAGALRALLVLFFTCCVFAASLSPAAAVQPDAVENPPAEAEAQLATAEKPPAGAEKRSFGAEKQSLSERQRAAQPSASSMTQAEVAAMVREVSAKVEAIRGLKFKSDVPVKVVDEASARAHFLSRVTKFWPQERVRKEQKVYIQLGLLPPGTDMFATVMKVVEEQAEGYYDPDSGTFFIRGDIPRGVAPILMAHELTHALDDQNYRVDGLLEGVKDDNDRLDALASVIEGSGTVVMAVFLAQELRQGRLSLDAIGEFQKREAGRTERLLAAPALIERELIAPYILGELFILHGDPARLAGSVADPDSQSDAAPRGGGDPEGAAPPKRSPLADDLDRLFRSPPQSTEQIIHPQKYWDESRKDPPRRAALPDLSPALGEGWSRTASGTLGELSLAALTAGAPIDLLSSGMTDSSRWTNQAAAGWGGDLWQLYANGEKNVTVLATLWDTEKDAEEFVAALKPLQGRQAWRRGDAVVVVAGDAGERAAALGKAALSALVKEGAPPGPAAPAPLPPAPAEKPAAGDCPTPSPNVICAALYAPVKCGPCVYPNACLAKAAGQNDKNCVRLTGDERPAGK